MHLRNSILIVILYIAISTILLISAPAEAGGLPQSLRFRNYSLAEGLSQGNVYAIEQDSLGFIWIGTQDGLNRFDGTEFRVYNNNPSDPASISGNKVNCLEPGRGGFLWIGTDNGLNRFSPLRGELERFLNSSEDSCSISSNLINDILLDSRGDLWVATGAGLDRSSGRSGVFEHFFNSPDDEHSLPPGRLNYLFEDSKGKLWICTDECLASFDSREESFYRYFPAGKGGGSKRENFVNTIIEDGSREYLVGTRGGVFRFNPDANSFRRIVIRCAEGSSYSDLYTVDMCRDSSGRVWVATLGFGVFICTEDLSLATRCHYRRDDPGSISYSTLNCIFQDRFEAIWIGTRGYGFSLWSPYYNKFERYADDNARDIGLGVRSVRAIYEQPGGDLWIGGYYGMDRLIRDDMKFEHFEEEGPADNIYVIEGDPRYPDSLIWLGSEGKGLYRYEIGTGSYYNYRIKEEGPEGLNGKFVYSICPDGYDGLYLGTATGITRFDFESESFEVLDSLGHEVKVRALMVDSGGSLWAGTEIGIAVRSSGSERFVFLDSSGKGNAGISTSTALSICEGEADAVWVGTAGGGLKQYDRQGVRVRVYTTEDGLPNNVIYGIVEDGGGKLWLSTNRGIASFDPAAEKVRLYGMEDGLQSMEFNSGAYHRGFSGKIYFGGINGFNVIDPANIRDDPYPPPVVFTGLKVLNRRIAPGDSINGEQVLALPIEAAEPIKLSSRHKIFSLSFAALNFTIPSKNRYAYRLEGLDEGWRNSGNYNTATFTALSPGDYRLIVKAANADGVWNDEGASLKISIAPLFWQTSTFRLSALAAFLLLMLIIYRIRTGFLRRHNAELDTVNRRLEEQIADRMRVEKALRESEQKYWIILDNLEIGVSLISREMKTVELNSSMKDLIPEAGTGRQPVSHLLEERFGAEAFSSGNPLNKTFQDGRAHEALCSMAVDEEESFLRIVVFPILDSDSAVFAAIELVEDVTEKELMEKRLMNSRKMEAIGQLAGGIAHDFNNLLFAMLGYAHLTKENLDPSSFEMEAVEKIEMAANRAADLVKQILSFSRKSEADRKPVRLDLPVREIITLLEGSLPSTVRIEYTITEPSPYIFADTAQIHQLLMNLCTNSYQAMPDQSGTLEIELEEFEAADEMGNRFPEFECDRYVRLSVRDDGAGMTKDVMDRIFEPYFTTCEDSERSGFGLSIVHNIVKGMNGEISVRSVPGKGTEFEIFIPAIEGIDEDEVPPASAQSSLSGEGNIMVVDDEKMITAMIEKYLAELGYNVCGYYDSSEALDDFLSDPDRFGLIISDVTMPGITGVELSSRIRKVRPGLPIIIITGYSDRIDERTAEELENTRFLKKPVSLEDMARTVKEIFSEDRNAAE